MRNKVGTSDTVRKYNSKTFYYPAKPVHELVWSYFEHIIAEAARPNTINHNALLKKPDVVRNLIFKHIISYLKKVNAKNAMTDTDRTALEALWRIQVTENAKADIDVGVNTDEDSSDADKLNVIVKSINAKLGSTARAVNVSAGNTANTAVSSTATEQLRTTEETS